MRRLPSLSRVRSSVFARLLVGTALAVLLAQLAGVTHVLAERSASPTGAWQGAADTAARTLLDGLDRVPPDEQVAEVLARARARGWSAHVLPSGPPPPRLTPPPPQARIVLASGDVLVVDAPGWRPDGFMLALAAQILLSVTGVGAVVLVLGRPLARDLERIRDTLVRFGDEDLSARVGPLRTRDVAPVGEAIDRMAGRIAVLVEGQRSLLQTVSHELRTPHARLRFRLERLAAADGERAHAAILASADRDLDEVEALLAELLAYVRVDGLQGVPRPSETTSDEDPETDVADWLVDIVEQADLGDSEVEVILTVPEGLPLPVAPRAWFARAVGNLVRNARRHARTRVEVAATLVDGAHLAVTVDDDGPGIPPDHRSRLLQPFEVGDGRAAEGSVGLGLAIAARVLSRAGGALRMDDAPIGGARVSTTWPVRSPAPPVS